MAVAPGPPPAPTWRDRVGDVAGYVVGVPAAIGLAFGLGYIDYTITSAVFDAINSGTAPGRDFYEGIRPYVVYGTTAAASAGGAVGGIYVGRGVRDFFRNVLW